MSWAPVAIKFNKIETNEYVEIRIPRIFKREVKEEGKKVQNEYHFDLPFTDIFVNQAHINKIERLDRAYCKYYMKQSTQGDDHLLHTGFFLQFPPYTFSLKKPNRIGFQGEKEFELFTYNPYFEEGQLETIIKISQEYAQQEFSALEILEQKKAIGSPLEKQST